MKISDKEVEAVSCRGAGDNGLSRVRNKPPLASKSAVGSGDPDPYQACIIILDLLFSPGLGGVYLLEADGEKLKYR